MTTIENNPYYQGTGEHDGNECHVYYDYHQKSWSVQYISNSKWVEDVDCDDIELNTV